jgi:hypothetical protein
MYCNIVDLAAAASKSLIRDKLAAMCTNGRHHWPIRTNEPRSKYNGHLAHCLHAEAAALKSVYGRRLIYTKNKWRVLWPNAYKH